MRILLVGATGFIGGNLLTALQRCQCTVIATSRSGRGPALPGVEWRALDLSTLADDPDTFTWPNGIDMVINASGLLGTDKNTLYAIQDRGARALFSLAEHHASRIIQVSALGAGDQPDIPFLDSKSLADEALLLSSQCAVILRPSMVIGPGGASSGWLSRLSPLPWIALMDTHSQVQPVHIDDLVGAVLSLMDRWPDQTSIYPVVGPDPMTLPQLIDRLRASQGWPPAQYMQLPRWVSATGARLGDRLGWQALNTQTLRMAGRDNTASPQPLEQACGFRAASFESRLGEWPNPLHSASLALRPILLGVMVVIWLGTAVACLGPGYAWGLGIMAEAGVHGWPASLAVIGGALLDAMLGIGLLSRYWRRPALKAQIALMLSYMVLITFLVPQYWYDPFASVLKNAGLLIATLWLLWTEPRATQPDTRKTQ